MTNETAENSPSKVTTFSMGNVVYDRLKWIAQILLPSLGTLYFAIAQIWHFPNAYAEEVVGTILAIDTFLGVLLGISSANYKKDPENFDGVLKVTATDPTKQLWSFEANQDLISLGRKDIVSFKVHKSQD